MTGTSGIRCLRNILNLMVVVLLFSNVFSCSGKDVGSFPWKSVQGGRLSFSQSVSFPKGSENKFSAARPENLYSLKTPLSVDPGYMLAVGMDLRVENLAVTLSLGQDAKKAGRETRFAVQPGHATFFLRAPDSRIVKTLKISVKSHFGQLDAKDETTIAEVESVAILPAFLGYEKLKDGNCRISEGLVIENQGSGSSLWSILSPFSDMLKSEGEKNFLPALTLKYAAASDADIVVRAGGKIIVKTASAKKETLLPASIFPDAAHAESLSITIPDTVSLESAYIESLPTEEALRVDPGIALLQPAIPENKDLAYYRWDLIPNVVIFDFRTYSLQDSYLKRLAFFVEKRGFTGTLAKDGEIASLHGWNAHDYNTDDLAKFYSAAKKTNFPLNAKEIWLKDFLVVNRLIVSQGQEYKGLGGAIISISQESPSYLRHTFLTHESAHAIFFADERYRQYCVSLWESMSKKEQWFWVLYFGWMNYDISSAYLMANEMQAYLIQQPVRSAEEYFSKTLVDRLLEKHPELKAPLQEYIDEFGLEFARKASLLDGWLRAAYGFGAGRTFFVR